MSLNAYHTRIFELRKMCSEQRQRSQLDRMSELAAYLFKFPETTHPYGLGPHFSAFVEQTGYFSSGAAGSHAQIPDTEFAYRIESIHKLVSRLTWREPYFFRDDADNAWTILNAASKSGNDWLGLMKYAMGTYPALDVNNWKFTWWTTFPVPEDVMLAVAKLGMYSSWVMPDTVLMRARVSSIQAGQLARVPTLVDAFFSPVFHTVFEDPVPNAGITIDLSTYPLGEGADEYVVAALGVEDIEICPVNIPSTARGILKDWVGQDEHNLKILVSYYETLDDHARAKY